MTSPDHIADLILQLPFYVNGTLPDTDRATIEAALGNSAELRAELDEIRALSSLVTRQGEAMSVAMEADVSRLDAILQKIDTATSVPQSQPHFRPIIQERRTPFWHSIFQPRWQPALAAGALAIIATQAGWIIHWANKPTAGDFTVLSGPGDALPRDGAILIRLNPDATWSAVEALLSRHGLKIIGGPDDLTITVTPSGKHDARNIEMILEQLRASPEVSFAGRQG
jgi:hypothetical protein